MRDDFAIFICTHGRPNAQLTLENLLSLGYNGKWYLVLDDTDTTIQEYIDKYGADKIIIFNKNFYINSPEYDNGDCKLHAKCILYAKRAVEDIAHKLGYKYFAIADDDIVNFCIRRNVDGHLKRVKITSMDIVFDAYINLLSCNHVAGLGFGYPVMYSNGIDTFSYNILSTRFMPYQFVIRNGDVPVTWNSWFGEDNITELLSSMLGNIWLLVPHVMQTCKEIGDTSGSGGMSDTYRAFTEFDLNFNIIRYCPYGTQLRIKDDNSVRLIIHKKQCFPQIISGRYKK